MLHNMLATPNKNLHIACSSYVKSASAAGAEEIITMIQRPKRRRSSMLCRGTVIVVIKSRQYNIAETVTVRYYCESILCLFLAC